jgi:hypothetical protein
MSGGNTSQLAVKLAGHSAFPCHLGELDFRKSPMSLHMRLIGLCLNQWTPGLMDASRPRLSVGGVEWQAGEKCQCPRGLPQVTLSGTNRRPSSRRSSPPFPGGPGGAGTLRGGGWCTSRVGRSGRRRRRLSSAVPVLYLRAAAAHGGDRAERSGGARAGRRCSSWRRRRRSPCGGRRRRPRRLGARPRGRVRDGGRGVSGRPERRGRRSGGGGPSSCASVRGLGRLGRRGFGLGSRGLALQMDQLHQRLPAAVVRAEQRALELLQVTASGALSLTWPPPRLPTAPCGHWPAGTAATVAPGPLRGLTDLHHQSESPGTEDPLPPPVPHLHTPWPFVSAVVWGASVLPLCLRILQARHCYRHQGAHRRARPEHCDQGTCKVPSQWPCHSPKFKVICGLWCTCSCSSHLQAPGHHTTHKVAWDFCPVRLPSPRLAHALPSGEPRMEMCSRVVFIHSPWERLSVSSNISVSFWWIRMKYDCLCWTMFIWEWQIYTYGDS